MPHPWEGIRMPATNKLEAALAGVRSRIAKARARGFNELETCASLVEPVLRALGWEVEDVEEVARQYRGESGGNPVDYALLVRREPILLVEVKALLERLDDRRHGNQIMGYSGMSGVEWIVLTNGDEYRIYNALAKVRIDEKLLRTVRVSEGTPQVEQILRLLAKNEIKTKRIDAMWQAHFVDRRVKIALEQLFSPRPDAALVAHVLRITKDLTAEHVRRSLRRCKFTLDIPLSPADIVGARLKKGATVRTKQAKPAGKVTLAQLIQAEVLKVPAKLTAKYMGTELQARVLANGTVMFGGKAFPSLASAGNAARESVKPRSSDGSSTEMNVWMFWKYRATDGSEQLVDHARQLYLVNKPAGAAANTKGE